MAFVKVTSIRLINLELTEEEAIYLVSQLQNHMEDDNEPLDDYTSRSKIFDALRHHVDPR